MKTSHFNSWFNRVEELLLVHQLDPAVDEDACILRSECSCALGLYNLRTYKALLPYQCPLHPYTPLLGRINAVYEATILATLSPAVLKTMLQPEWNADLRGLCQSFFNIRHQPLISTIARKISSSFYWNTSLDDIYSIEDGSSWFSLAVEVISQTPDVHATDIDRRTALIVLIHDAAFLWFYHPLQMGSRRYNIGKPLISMHRTLEAWLDAMRQVGVDLNDYGRREMELFRQIDLNIIRIGGWLDALRLIGITYGPRPEDWRIHIDEPTDGFAGEFWELIEDKPLPIPGAWIDE
ncbi:hypothetical protein F5B20DRAFT_63152 [Whalleya microplaca]|nr:hypothetical protein F5B20DRAFT_63152 [Whalleya microplaca]